MQKTKKLSLAEKVTRLRVRVRDPEWRRYFKIILAGKALGIALMLVVIFALPLILRAFSGTTAYGQTTMAAAAPMGVMPADLSDITKNPTINPINTAWTLIAGGCGTQRGYAESYRGNRGVLRLVSKVKLEIAVNENYVRPTVQAILKAARSGKIGDGKIFVLPLEECYRIRTGEMGGAAIGP